MKRHDEGLDEEIIELLCRSGRQSVRAMSQALSRPESTVRARLKKLVDSGAITYGLLVDMQVTNLEKSGWLYFQVAPALARSVATRLAENERVSLCSLVSGKFNVLSYLYAEDAVDLQQAIETFGKYEGVQAHKFREVISVPVHRYEYAALSEIGRSAFWQLGDID